MSLDRGVMALALAGLILSPVAAWAQSATTPASSTTATPAATDTTTPAASTTTTPAPAAATTAAPAAAAPAVAPKVEVPAAVQAWAKFCDPDPKDQHKVCIVRKLVFNNASIIGSFVLRIDSKKGVPTLAIAAVPTGIVLRPGLRWQIDNGKAQAIPFWRCTAQSCESETLVRNDFIARLRKGSTLKLTAKDVNNKDFVVSVALSGFSAAYDNADPPTFAQYTQSLPK